MIRFRDTILENYFIDPVTAIITNSKGEIQETRIHQGRSEFKGMSIHVIQVHTHYGYKKGFVIHHIDHNKMNNSLENLMYLTQNEHVSIHNHDKKGIKLSEETRKKISKANKGEKNPMYGKHRYGENSPMYGKSHSPEAKKKISDAHKGKKLYEETKKKMSESQKGEKNGMYGKKYKWINNGIEQKYVPLDEDIPEGFKRGMLKSESIKMRIKI